MSGFCTKASFFKGLNSPVFLKFFSIISDIFSPNSFTFKSLYFSDLISTCKGDTAIGRGSRFPRVISISINANELLNKQTFNKKIIKRKTIVDQNITIKGVSKVYREFYE